MVEFTLGRHNLIIRDPRRVEPAKVGSMLSLSNIEVTVFAGELI